MLADLVGEFLVDSTYSESLLLPPKLVVNVASLSGLSGGLGDAFRPSVSCEKIEYSQQDPNIGSILILTGYKIIPLQGNMNYTNDRFNKILKGNLKKIPTFPVPIRNAKETGET